MKAKGFLIWGMVLCVALMAGPAALTAQAQAAKPTVLRVTDFYPDAHPIGQGFRKYFIPELEKKSGGRVKIDYYGQETLVKARDMFDATAAGTADIGNMVYAGSKVPLMYFQQLPGVYDDEESVRAALAFWSVSQKYVAPLFEKKGLKLLYGFTTTGYQVMTTQKPVRKIADFKGLKVRASGSVLPNSVKAMQSVPVNMPASDAYEALERRVLDGIALAVPSVKGYSFYELIKYATINANLGGYPIYYAMNIKTWQKLPKDIQKILDDMSTPVTAKTTDYYLQQVSTDLNDWKKKGIELIRLPKEETKKAAKMLAPVWAKWVSDMQAKGMPMKDLIADWQKALAKEKLELDPELLAQLPWNKK
jgi:TRAP-type C4-dicarboxylate transport system substrate-binding protein